jgi:hypothetical protein
MPGPGKSLVSFDATPITIAFPDVFDALFCAAKILYQENPSNTAVAGLSSVYLEIPISDCLFLQATRRIMSKR